MISKTAHDFSVFCQLVEVVKILQVHEAMIGGKTWYIASRIDRELINTFGTRTDAGFLLRVNRDNVPLELWTPWGSIRLVRNRQMLWKTTFPKMAHELGAYRVKRFISKLSGHDGHSYAVMRIGSEELPKPKLTLYWALVINHDQHSRKKEIESNAEHGELRSLWNKHCTQWLTEHGHI